MAAEPNRLLTPAEYLERERAGELKHEYVAGEVYAMVGASWPHNLIASATFLSLGRQLEGSGCTILPSDMRVKIAALNIYTYPDISIVCGKPELEDKEFDTLLNPTVIAEILSPSTEGYDRGLKFQRYRLIPAFREYLLIAQDTLRVEHAVRQPDNSWSLAAYTAADDVIALPAVGCTLALADVYRKVAFDAQE